MKTTIGTTDRFPADDEQPVKADPTLGNGSVQTFELRPKPETVKVEQPKKKRGRPSKKSNG